LLALQRYFSRLPLSGCGGLYTCSKVDTLFELRDAPSFDRERLRDRLQEFAARGIYIGGSSWKYEGWLDQIYRRSRYLTRGRFSKKLFEETCLQEYASIFPAVCGDFSFYQFPSENFWAKLFRQTPEPFRWGFKIPEQISVPVWPMHPRYGALAGQANPAFLDVALLDRDFLRALAPYRRQVGVLVFEFGTFTRNIFATTADFIEMLDPFLASLPAGWRYAVEIRNADFLLPRFFDCLRAYKVTHVYNSWTRMPGIREQRAIAGSQTSDMIVSRALLKGGRPYEEAVQRFAPYREVQEVNEDVRTGLREIVDVAMVDGIPAFIFINNRLEGNSPGTIIAITD
jgi:uncharacterized protein YecE (DUF72 family)